MIHLKSLPKCRV